MYCPKCRIEFMKGISRCSDCDIALVESLPPAAESEMHDNRLHPIRDQINKTIDFIRNNQKATWIFSLLVGVIFYIAYVYSLNFWAHSISRVIEHIASQIDPSADLNGIKVVLITIGVNVLTKIPAAFIASLFCASLMIYVLRKRQLHYFFGTVAVYFLLVFRRWHFWNAPDIGLLISSFVGPFLVMFVYILTAWLLIKFFLKEQRINERVE